MYLIPISPKPTPRPNYTKFGVYNKPSYTKYKKNLISYILSLNIPPKDYDAIYAKFFVPYPKGTSKKKLIEGLPLKQVFDCDNVIKGLCDALEQSKVISNDRCISHMYIEKYRTKESKGRIEFTLY